MNSMNRFAFNPASLDIPRSLFDRSCDRFQSLRGGVLQPIYVDEMLPGDSVTMKTNAFIRMSKPILPTMDPLYCDIFFFFVPMRLVWNSYKQFFGENDPDAWTDVISNLELPHLDSNALTLMKNSGVYKSGSLLDCLGVHLGCDNVDSNTLAGVVPIDSLVGLNTLPIRAYYAIAENWFRDENYATPYAFSLGDSGTNDWRVAGVNTPIHQDGLCPVYALHDYFTSALPAPQRGPDIRPLGEGVSPDGVMDPGLYAPVSAGVEHIGLGDDLIPPYIRAIDSNGDAGGGISGCVLIGDSGALGTGTNASYTTSRKAGLTNLWATLPAEIFASVNQIRYAFALQRFFEKDARGGARYREKIKAHFGVSGSDSSMMVPEYLGGQRFMLNMDTIITTADTSDGTTGEYAGYSKTFQRLPQWSFSTSEHGYLMGLCCIRPKMTYHQGIPKMFMRKDQLDFYWPSFANLGEQPIIKKEIFAGVQHEDLPFGYNEPYAEYRFKPSELVGALRPESEDFIPGYTYARKLTDISANAGTVREVDPNIIKQNLAVPTGTEFVSMFHFEAKWRRPMPVYSIPGLVDHH